MSAPEGPERINLNIEEFAQNMADDIIRSVLEVEPDSTESKFNEDHETLAEELAQNMADEIIRSVLKVKPDSTESKFNEDHETLAEELAAAVVESALREASRGLSQTSTDSESSRPSLSKSGLPVAGSLDYPDAPPTTPLLPELEKSRRSFARKLKGGLAKVYLPSPPPSSPRDGGDNLDGDPQVELMEHLMRLLSTDDLARDYFEAGAHCGAKMEVFAEALSCDIIDWVLSAKKREQSDGAVGRLAQRLAETIISSSLDEAKMLV